MTEMNSKRTPDYSHCNGDPEVSAAAKYTHCNGNPAEAPTPDLGAQGEPVAWIWEYELAGGDWAEDVGRSKPEGTGYIRNVRALGVLAEPQPEVQGQPTAWAYEYCIPNGDGVWERRVDFDKPRDGHWLRNVEPLFRPAPTPDLGARGEPVAWAWEEEYLSGWRRHASVKHPGERRGARNARPLGFLDEAPAASRTGSGVSLVRDRLKVCPEEGSDEHLCAFPSCTCAYKRLPYPGPGTQSEPVAMTYEDVVRRLYAALPNLTQDEAQCVAESAFPELLRNGAAIAPAAPHSGSGATVDEVAQALYEHDVPEPRFLWPIQNERMAANYRSRARAILALIAQAPRDGGETQGRIATESEREPNAAVTAEIERGLARCSDHVRYAIRKEASDLIGLHAPGNRHLEQAVIAALLRRTAQSQKGTAR